MNLNDVPAIDRNRFLLGKFAEQAEAIDRPGNAFLLGFQVGVALTSRAPESARELRRVLEGITGDANGMAPERIEGFILDGIAAFDLSADGR